MLNTIECKRCKRELMEEEFAIDNRRKNGRQVWCKLCQKEYRENNIHKIKEYQKKWYAERPDYDRRRNVERTFSITLEEYDAYFVDATCGICNRSEKLVLDHDHDTGEIRGVLCATCNSGIGLLRDSKELCLKAAEWLS